MCVCGCGGGERREREREREGTHDLWYNFHLIYVLVGSYSSLI